MTGLQEVKISIADLLKAALAGVPCLIAIISAIWYFSAWSAKVDMRQEREDLRLDDIDKDLRSIHELYEHSRPAPKLDRYILPNRN